MPDAELVKNRAQMRVDCSTAEKERLGDLVVGHSPRHEPQDLDLSRRQVLEAGRCRRVRFSQVDARRRRRAVMPHPQEWHPLCLAPATCGGRSLPFLTQRRSRSSSLHRQEYLLCRRNRP
jgi:hypothetical protein